MPQTQTWDERGNVIPMSQTWDEKGNPIGGEDELTKKTQAAAKAAGVSMESKPPITPKPMGMVTGRDISPQEETGRATIEKAERPFSEAIERGVSAVGVLAPLVAAPIGGAPLIGSTLGKMATSAAGSAIGSEIGRTGTRWLGGSQEAQDIAGYTGALTGGLAGWREPPARVGWRGLGVDIPDWLRPEGAVMDTQKGLGAFMNRGYKPVESPKVITMAPETTSSGEATRYSASVSRPLTEGYSGASTGPPAEITVKGTTKGATEVPRSPQGARPTPGEQRLSDLLSKQIITPEDQREVVRSLGEDALPQQGESTASWKARVKGLIRAGRNARGVPDTESYPAPRRFNR